MEEATEGPWGQSQGVPWAPQARGHARPWGAGERKARHGPGRESARLPGTVHSLPQEVFRRDNEAQPLPTAGGHRLPWISQPITPVLASHRRTSTVCGQSGSVGLRHSQPLCVTNKTATLILSVVYDQN